MSTANMDVLDLNNPADAAAYLIRARNYVAATNPPPGFIQKSHANAAPIGDPVNPAIVDASYIYLNDRPLLSVAYPDFIGHGSELTQREFLKAFYTFLLNHGLKFVDNGKTGYDPLCQTKYFEVQVDRADYIKGRRIVDCFIRGTAETPEHLYQDTSQATAQLTAGELRYESYIGSDIQQRVSGLTWAPAIHCLFPNDNLRAVVTEGMSPSQITQIRIDFQALGIELEEARTDDDFGLPCLRISTKYSPSTNNGSDGALELYQVIAGKGRSHCFEWFGSDRTALLTCGPEKILHRSGRPTGHRTFRRMLQALIS